MIGTYLYSLLPRSINIITTTVSLPPVRPPRASLWQPCLLTKTIICKATNDRYVDCYVWNNLSHFLGLDQQPSSSSSYPRFVALPPLPAAKSDPRALIIIILIGWTNSARSTICNFNLVPCLDNNREADSRKGIHSKYLIPEWKTTPTDRSTSSSDRSNRALFTIGQLTLVAAPVVDAIFLSQLRV